MDEGVKGWRGVYGVRMDRFERKGEAKMLVTIEPTVYAEVRIVPSIAYCVALQVYLLLLSILPLLYLLPSPLSLYMLRSVSSMDPC